MATSTTRTIFVAYVPAASKLESALLTRDGAWFVGARYFANAPDAAKHRRLEAERLRRDAVRGIPAAHRAIRQLLRKQMVVQSLMRAGSSSCPWCGRPILWNETAVECGGRLVHDVKCAGELETVLED